MFQHGNHPPIIHQSTPTHSSPTYNHFASQKKEIYQFHFLCQDSINRLHNLRRNLLRLLRPIHLHRNIRITSLHGIDIGMELFQPNLHLLLGIIASLFQSRQHLLFLRGAEGHVIDLTGFRIGATSHDAFDEDVVGDVEEDEAVSGNAGVGEGFGLGGCAGEAVEEPAGFDAVGFEETIFDNSNNNLIRYQLARIHKILGLFAHIGTRRNRRPEHIPCTQMNHTVLVLNKFALRSLSTGGGTGNNKLGCIAAGIVGGVIGSSAITASFGPFGTGGDFFFVFACVKLDDGWTSVVITVGADCGGGGWSECYRLGGEGICRGEEEGEG
mmetsp:Transcript_35169/g.59696  ORF Transcript_35169/g.59696 Transcript_35169/m.59696 type:complete len:326 (-) Transcript_35169:26-1003(-)